MTEITDEQRADWQRLVDISKAAPDFRMQAILDRLASVLPSELTNPQPALPTEPDLYVSASYGNEYAWRFDDQGDWWLEGRWVDLKVVASNAPFTRLISERLQITREQLVAHLENHLDGSWNPESIAETVLSLVNGNDRD